MNNITTTQDLNLAFRPKISPFCENILSVRRSENKTVSLLGCYEDL